MQKVRSRLAGCPTCGAVYVYGGTRGACSVCGTPHPLVSGEVRTASLVTVARAAVEQQQRTPWTKSLVARAAGAWVVVLAVVVWAVI